MIAIIGFLLMVSLMVNSVMDALSNVIVHYFPGFTLYVLVVINNVLTFCAIVILFAIIFKVLPDARIKWSNVRVGAVVTAVLFMLGKFLIGFYLAQSSVTSIFGGASSIIIMMVWIYYNAFILYFGAEFTQVYARAMGNDIYPEEYAVKVK
jgi:membrane protein